VPTSKSQRQEVSPGGRAINAFILYSHESHQFGCAFFSLSSACPRRKLYIFLRGSRRKQYPVLSYKRRLPLFSNFSPPLFPNIQTVTHFLSRDRRAAFSSRKWRRSFWSQRQLFFTNTLALRSPKRDQYFAFLPPPLPKGSIVLQPAIGTKIRRRTQKYASLVKPKVCAESIMNVELFSDAE